MVTDIIHIGWQVVRLACLIAGGIIFAIAACAHRRGRPWQYEGFTALCLIILSRE